MADVADFPAIAALVIFCLAICLTVLLVFKTVAVHVPIRGRKPFRLVIQYYSAPVAAVLAMLACNSMTIGDVGRGLLGNSQIQPYGILILFMSMAYIAGSLDATGVFAWLALKFTALSGGRGHVLFLFYFLLSSFITTFTSNDVCILTLTPIVCYFAKATGADPIPFLYAEYAAANTFGALLYTGNPTNIIVAQAYDMTFLGYSKYMTLPTFAAGAACIAALLAQFHDRIPPRIPLPSLDASHMLRDVPGALLGSANMLACLALLAAAPSLGWAMWAITLVCAGLHAGYNAWAFRDSLLAVPLRECWTCGCEREGKKQGEAEGKGAGGGKGGAGAVTVQVADAAMEFAKGALEAEAEAGTAVAVENGGCKGGPAMRRAVGVANGGADKPSNCPSITSRGDGGAWTAFNGSGNGGSEHVQGESDASNGSGICRTAVRNRCCSGPDMNNDAADCRNAGACGNSLAHDPGGPPATAAAPSAAAAAALELSAAADIAAAMAATRSETFRMHPSDMLLAPAAVGDGLSVPPGATAPPPPLPGPALAAVSSGCGASPPPATALPPSRPAPSAEPPAAELPAGEVPAAGPLTAPFTELLVSADPLAAAEPPTAESLRGAAPTFWGLLFGLPWEVVPFALGMFVLVEALHVQGWLEVFGSGLGRASSSLPAAIFLMGVLSVALANTINNQPMTILLTRVALDARYMGRVVHGNTHKAALFALVLGSNIGAVFTLIGALAGILWSNIVGQHGLRVSYGQFARTCVPVGLASLAASLLALWLEFAVFPHDD